ncbi:hypothetical protein DVK02_17515, partial [Halobellus sp. Atlit-31R]
HEAKKDSVVVEAPADQVVGSTMLSEADRRALKDQENARIAAALSGGQSAVGTQVGAGGVHTPAIQPQPPLTQQGEMRIDQQGQQPPMSHVQPQAPAEADQAKVQGLEKQMERIMTAWGMDAAGGQRTLSTYVREPNKASGASDAQGGQQSAGGTTSQRPANDLMIVKAYEQ